MLVDSEMFKKNKTSTDNDHSPFVGTPIIEPEPVEGKEVLKSIYKLRKGQKVAVVPVSKVKDQGSQMDATEETPREIILTTSEKE